MISHTYHVPESELRVGDPAIINYPLTGKTLWQAKVVEVQSSAAHLVYVDVDSRQVVDGESIKQLEKEYRREKYGKLDPGLYDRLQTLQDSETVKVFIWLVGVNVEQIRREVSACYPEAKLEDTWATEETPRQLLEKVQAEVREAEKQAYQEREAPLIAFLEGQGFKVRFAAHSASLVSAELPKTGILAVAQREDVVRIALVGEGGGVSQTVPFLRTGSMLHGQEVMTVRVLRSP